MIHSLNMSAFGIVWGNPKAPIASSPDFVSFTLAVNEKYTDRDTGGEIKKTIWIDCKSNHPKMSKVILDYVKDGNKIFIEGRGRPIIYMDKEDMPKTKMVINVRNFNMLNDLPKNEEEQE